MHGGYYRPAYVHDARIGVDAQGMPVAWQHGIVGQSIMAGTPFEAAMVKNGIDATSVEGVADSPYLKEIAEPPRRACIRREPPSRCCGGARSATATPPS